MAAIVARLTRRRRERSEFEKEYETSKCMYELPPFCESFEPMKHNKYLMRRRDVVGRYYSSQAYYQRCAENLASADNERIIVQKLMSPFTWKQFIFETIIIGLLVSPFIVIIVVTEMLYSYAEFIDERAIPFGSQD